MTVDGRRRVNARGQGARLRTELLDAAARLFDDGGRQATVTLRGVAREAGVAAPSIYDHFPRLDDLLGVLAEGYLLELAEVLDRAACRGRDPDPDLRLRTVARAYLRWGLDRPGPYALVFEGRGRRPDPGPEQSDRWAVEPLNTLASVLSGRDPAPANPRLAALSVWTGLHGIVTLRAARPDVGWPALNRHLDAVLVGVLPA
jgi:AcrR family transcriptional regulator